MTASCSRPRRRRAPGSLALAARRLSDLLGSVRYFPVALILAEYARDIFTPRVRALVFDEDEPLSNAGSYGFHDLNIVRYTFSGRQARPYLRGEMDLEALLRLGEERLNRHIPVAGRERLRFVGRHFELGLCAYTRHYRRFAGGLQEELRALPGLYLAGDYLCGASIEAPLPGRRDMRCGNRRRPYSGLGHWRRNARPFRAPGWAGGTSRSRSPARLAAAGAAAAKAGPARAGAALPPN